MKDISRKTTIAGIVINSFLFVIKFIAGMITHSLTVISDSLNSLTDIVASIGIFFAVRISGKKADDGHPFGHHRAEPVAGLIVAIFVGIVGFEVINKAFSEYFNPVALEYGYIALLVMGFTLVVKAFMALYFLRIGKEVNSPAIRASGVDAKNDMIISIIAVLGVLGPMYGYSSVDNYIAFFLGLYIIYSGYKIGMENIDYLMGHAPSQAELKQIKELAMTARKVKGLNDVRAHYVGNYIHVEVHIEVPKKMSTKESHDVGKEVQRKIEALPHVDKAFIHVDPV